MTEDEKPTAAERTNIPIRRIGYVVMALFCAMLLNVNWLQALRAEELNNHRWNTMRLQDAFNQARGPIMVGQEAIAVSEDTSEDENADWEYQRTYPQGDLYAHIVGYYSPAGQSTGIEFYENTLLSGEDQRLAVSRFLDTISGEEEQGAQVELTLDPDAQQAAYDAFRQVNPNANGAAVAIEPDTGRILASVSVPSFDPNQILSEPETYTELNENDNQPLLNRAFNEVYPPGSTFKIVTAAAALENGYSIDEPLSGMGPQAAPRPEGGADLPNAFTGACGDGSPSIALSIEISCNTSFANLALDLGADAMTEQAEAFGFNGEQLELPMPAAVSSYPDTMEGSPIGQNQVFDSGIGQGLVQATPLQMAMVAAGVANDGRVMRPYLVDRVVAPDLTTQIEANSPELLSEAMSPDTANAITDAMVQVTQGANGSGPGGAVPGYEVAGKTGTAENAGPTHNWFISFAPADDPQIAVAVVVENGGGSGGSLAAPVAAQIMEAVLE
ncbi:peptidoglycan D,D-transpeptidase FtsI family protein [Allonocardiopsis opalescens]|uniref:Cell elongation-specific peptidoglycan D,D-transpeptidase n=1 Tax=Allonocardiopsis opalescens TaxID=1144618 RepID=A0A2T0Q732_9ACTN|nr:penicillin-binding protein 2 [Allonocardiopsis opalescens]PRX99604.1 cell elongation-specific peptidoglycan D,D-transpeptidase [Allonocardiopsis opalescens]